MVAKLVMAGLAAAASVAQGLSSMSSARAQQSAAAAQVANARRQAEIDAATQASDRARRLEAAQSAQVAHAAARGIDLNSFDPIARSDQEAYLTDKAIIEANKGGRLYNLDLYGWDAEQSAKAKRTSALFGIGKSLFDFGGSVYKEFGGGSSGGSSTYPSRTRDAPGGY